jgi:hypothetical protein
MKDQIKALNKELSKTKSKDRIKTILEEIKSLKLNNEIIK